MNTKLTMLSLVVSAALAGCSSGTATGPGSAIGVITGFGSVYVNGVEYETGGASVDIDGQAGTENDLAVGQMVTLHGSINANGITGNATSISFADNVEGVVISTAIAADGTGSLDVMGQTVTVTAQTLFESGVTGINLINDIVNGNIVEVSGFSQGDGNITATYIEAKASSFSGQVMEVKGLVSALDTGAKTFQIGSLVVDYGSATMELGSRALANGLYVEAKTMSAISGSTMAASKVELESDGDMDIDVAEGEEIKIRGLITEVGADYIILNGQTVYFTGSVESEDGLALENLSTGMMVELEAYMSAAGQLMAMEVESEKEDDFSIRAHLQAVDMVNKTVTILGQTIHVDTNTMMRDERDEGITPVRYFNLDDLLANNWIKVKFYRDATRGLVATRLERDDDNSAAGAFKMEGLVEQVDATTFTIAGVVIDLSHYGTAAVGQELEVTGTYLNGVLVINSVVLNL
ncbi:MAG: DUF5666 domain-containing protein [Gammaproteobacteria bacterium]|nr:DUF5666 domain-containing protein [Gammaproteobacteria bacterium]